MSKSYEKDGQIHQVFDSYKDQENFIKNVNDPKAGVVQPPADVDFVSEYFDEMQKTIDRKDWIPVHIKNIEGANYNNSGVYAVEIREWLDENITNGYEFRYGNFRFKNQEEAMYFKLVWES